MLINGFEPITVHESDLVNVAKTLGLDPSVVTNATAREKVYLLHKALEKNQK